MHRFWAFVAGNSIVLFIAIAVKWFVVQHIAMIEACPVLDNGNLPAHIVSDTSADYGRQPLDMKNHLGQFGCLPCGGIMRFPFLLMCQNDKQFLRKVADKFQQPVFPAHQLVLVIGGIVDEHHLGAAAVTQDVYKRQV